MLPFAHELLLDVTPCVLPAVGRLVLLDVGAAVGLGVDASVGLDVGLDVSPCGLPKPELDCNVTPCVLPAVGRLVLLDVAPCVLPAVGRLVLLDVGAAVGLGVGAAVQLPLTRRPVVHALGWRWHPPPVANVGSLLRRVLRHSESLCRLAKIVDALQLSFWYHCLPGGERPAGAARQAPSWRLSDVPVSVALLQLQLEAVQLYICISKQLSALRLQLEVGPWVGRLVLLDVAPCVLPAVGRFVVGALLAMGLFVGLALGLADGLNVVPPCVPCVVGRFVLLEPPPPSALGLALGLTEGLAVGLWVAPAPEPPPPPALGLALGLTEGLAVVGAFVVGAFVVGAFVGAAVGALLVDLHRRFAFEPHPLPTLTSFVHQEPQGPPPALA